MQVGFVNIFGHPNAGKSTLLNALIGEKLAIVSPKVQTTRHRIKGILTTDTYQLVFSDTPGIITPKYKLQEKMMEAVRSALEDGDAETAYAHALAARNRGARLPCIREMCGLAAYHSGRWAEAQRCRRLAVGARACWARWTAVANQRHVRRAPSRARWLRGR